MRRRPAPSRPADVRGLRRVRRGKVRRVPGAPARGRPVHPVRRCVRWRRPVSVMPGRLPAGRTLARFRFAAGGAVTCPRCGRRMVHNTARWLGGVCPACVLDHYTLPGGRVTNAERAPVPGFPGARERYRAAGLCVWCGADRDRQDRLTCETCRRRAVAASRRWRAGHPGRHARLQSVSRKARRAQWTAAGLCRECGGERDRPADRKLCAGCRRKAREKTAEYRRRRAETARPAGDDALYGDSSPPDGLTPPDRHSPRMYPGP